MFRGSPWAVSRPHNYVLFEWDTYLSSFMAAVTDKWTARSNIIRMTKSLNYQVRKRETFILKSFHQDRLGTNNSGKLKHERLCVLAGFRRWLLERAVW